MGIVSTSFKNLNKLRDSSIFSNSDKHPSYSIKMSVVNHPFSTLLGARVCMHAAHGTSSFPHRLN